MSDCCHVWPQARAKVIQSDSILRRASLIETKNGRHRRGGDAQEIYYGSGSRIGGHGGTVGGGGVTIAPEPVLTVVDEVPVWLLNRQTLAAEAGAESVCNANTPRATATTITIPRLTFILFDVRNFLTRSHI